jgi:hypothetical protein
MARVDDRMTRIQMDKNRRAFELVGTVTCGLVMGLVVYAMNQSSVTSAGRNKLEMIVNVLVSTCCYLSVFGLFDRFLPLYFKNLRLNWLAISLFGTLLSFIAVTSPVWWAHGSFSLEYALAALSILTVLTLVMLSVMASVVGVGSLSRLILREVEAFRVIP